MTDVIRIEQRLQDPPLFFIMPADEAIAFGIPAVLGLISRQVFVGILFGVFLFVFWKRVKRGGGVPQVLALFYWILPREMTPYRSLPDSAVTVWRA